MPYIQRDENNNIVGVYAQPQDFATEFSENAVEIDLPYQMKRAAAYPPLSEFADAFYWLQKGDGAKMSAYIAACDTVKDSHPKTEAS